MIVIGLTGSIGMGKSTTASMFAEAGIPVNDSDAVVHALYSGEAVVPVEKAFPGSVLDGAVNREELSRQLRENPAKFKIIEEIVHPLVREKEKVFLEQHRRIGSPVVVLDIPLLFETGAESRVDTVVVVSCDAAIQKQRVLSRPGMTEEKFALILSRQLTDSEKRRRADFIIDTGKGLEAARHQVADVISALMKTR